jgi:hypothetical protein
VWLNGHEWAKRQLERRGVRYESLDNGFRSKHSTVKQYLKEGRALRTETTFNDAYDIDVGRRIDNLALLREHGEAINERLLEHEADAETARLEGPELTDLVRPLVRGDRRIAALRIGVPRVTALLAAVVRHAHLPWASPTPSSGDTSPRSRAHRSGSTRAPA